MEFTILEPNTEYKIFVSAESVVPYKPRQRISDNNVRSITIKTAENLNLKGS